MELTFILTEECNLRCTYCYQKNYPRTLLSREMAETALQSALNHGAKHLSLTFFGGEPLLQAPTLFSILETARRLERESGISVTAKVSTNGLELDSSVIRNAAPNYEAVQYRLISRKNHIERRLVLSALRTVNYSSEVFPIPLSARSFVSLKTAIHVHADLHHQRARLK